MRYLGIPGQAISYKLGERAWLAGREAAQQARGADFDLKAWHMAALSQGSLGLDDLAAELAALCSAREPRSREPGDRDGPWPGMAIDQACPAIVPGCSAKTADTNPR